LFIVAGKVFPGQITPDMLTIFVIEIPAVILGSTLGTRTSSYLSEDVYRILLFIALAGIGASIVWSAAGQPAPGSIGRCYKIDTLFYGYRGNLMNRIPDTNADIDDTSTWVKYRKKLCDHCNGSCCTLPVEVKTSDLVRMQLMDEFELEEAPKKIARRLMKERVVEHFHSKSETFTLARMANGDCLYLETQTRRCIIYDKRPDTCRNHPKIGPRDGFCAFRNKTER